MLNANNTYFAEFKRISDEFKAARDERENCKQKIIDTYGWESDELKAWYEEGRAVVFPFSQGVCKAYYAWQWSLSMKEDEVEMEDFLWEDEVADFIDAFRKAKIETFVYTNKSSAVMENLHWFVAEGCKIKELCTITRPEHYLGEEKPVEIMGVRFSLN